MSKITTHIYVEMELPFTSEARMQIAALLGKQFSDGIITSVLSVTGPRPYNLLVVSKGSILATTAIARFLDDVPKVLNADISHVLQDLTPRGVTYPLVFDLKREGGVEGRIFGLFVDNHFYDVLVVKETESGVITVRLGDPFAGIAMHVSDGTRVDYYRDQMGKIIEHAMILEQIAEEFPVARQVLSS